MRNVMLTLKLCTDQPILALTMEAFREACQIVARLCFEDKITRQSVLRRAVQDRLTSEFRLSVLQARAAISIGLQMADKDRTKVVMIPENLPMPFVDETYSFKKRLIYVSLLCSGTRENFEFAFEGYRVPPPEWLKQYSFLTREQDTYYLYCPVPDQLPVNFDDAGLSMEFRILQSLKPADTPSTQVNRRTPIVNPWKGENISAQ